MRAAACAPLVAGAGAGAYWLTMSSQSQLLGAFPNVGPEAAERGDRKVALTFDDGPNEPFTGAISAALAERGVRATFFAVGRAVARDPDTVRGVLAAGHVVGNHSFTHRLHRCFTAASIQDEIQRAQAAFAEHLDLVPRLYRPPWLVRTPATFRLLADHGLTPVSGTFCHPFEVSRASGPAMARLAVSRTTPGRMIIFHDGYNGGRADRSRTLDAVTRVADTLLDRGWTFATVDELLSVAPYATDDPAFRLRAGS